MTTTSSYYQIRKVFVIALSLLFLNFQQQQDVGPLFSSDPIWTSGSTYGGGDGNAQWLDADRDGDPDLVTSVPDPRRWAIFLNENGQLADSAFWESQETTDCDHISVKDFNQDGWPDLAGTHESHCTLYFNSGDKNKKRFNEHPDWETGFYTDANQIDFGDFDQDGDLDMLMASGLPVFGLAIFENINGTISTSITRTLGPREYSESSIFADFDQDGDLDIVATYSKVGSIYIFKNDGRGQFDQGTLVYLDEEVQHVQRVYCIDIDQDGTNELFCAKGPWGPPGASVGLAQPSEGKTLKVVWRSGVETGYHGFDFEDIDQDGDLDMAAADWPRKTVSIFLQKNGKFSETPDWMANTPDYAHEVDFADMDGDGDLDLAVGCRDQALVYENQLKKSEAYKILQRAIDAMGGDQILNRLKSQMMWMERGTDYSSGTAVPFVGQYAAKWPHWYREEIEGLYQLTSNGQQAWASSQAGTQILEGIPLKLGLEQVRRAWAERLFPLKDKTYTLSEIDGIEVNGRKCVGLLAKYKEGGDIKFYFDEKTYLIAKMETTLISPEFGPDPVTGETFFMDHKSFYGVLMPGKYQLYYNKKLYAEVETVDYKLFATLDPQWFEPPE